MKVPRQIDLCPAKSISFALRNRPLRGYMALSYLRAIVSEEKLEGCLKDEIMYML